MSAPRLSDINLLPKNSFELSNTGRTLRWMKASGRVIVVITEFAVIIAFGSRFWFDKALNDLSDVVQAKQAVVKNYGDVETRMRDVLSREDKVSDFLQNNILLSQVYDQIMAATPTDVTYDQVGMSNTSGIQLNGKAKSEVAFASLISNLSRQKLFGTIQLGETKFSQQSGQVEFKISAKINRKEVT